MSVEETARKMQRMATDILAVLSRDEGTEDFAACFGALGSVVGCLAKASDNATGAMHIVNMIANGVIDDSLLNPEVTS